MFTARAATCNCCARKSNGSPVSVITVPVTTAPAAAPAEVSTCPVSRTSLVAIRPNETVVFSCETASVTRAASVMFDVPGK